MHAGAAYPSDEHPAGRFFTWEAGRVLPAFQLVAISEGRGLFSSDAGDVLVEAGDVFILRPGVWHRYRPDVASGWTEDWFELRGLGIDRWLAGGILETLVYKLEEADSFFHRFGELHHVCKKRLPGYRAVSAGLAMALVGQLTGQGRQGGEKGRAMAALIENARDRLLAGRNIKEVAQALRMSYPNFHRRFKQATGLPPKEYVSQVRQARAEALLAGGQLSIKEIAAELGFNSAGHFSAEFKRRSGQSPKAWKSCGVVRWGA